MYIDVDDMKSDDPPNPQALKLRLKLYSRIGYHNIPEGVLPGFVNYGGSHRTRATPPFMCIEKGLANQADQGQVKSRPSADLLNLRPRPACHEERELEDLQECRKKRAVAKQEGLWTDDFHEAELPLSSCNGPVTAQYAAGLFQSSLQPETQGFEEVEFPPRLPENLSLVKDVPVSSRCSPLSANEFATFWDSDGRLVDEHRLRQAVFRGGIEPGIRKQVWQFLFGLYPFCSTAREREILMAEHTVRYRALKKRWKAALAHDDEGRGLHRARYSESEITGRQESCESEGSDCCPASPEMAVPLPNMPSPDVQQHRTFIDIQAEVYAGRQPLDDAIMKKAIRIIDKDVPRTDRDHEYFRGSGNPHLVVLRDVLITYATYHSEVNYAQGMNDLVSRFLLVLDSEVEAYWCFSHFMETIRSEFLEEGILDKLTVSICWIEDFLILRDLVKQLLGELDPDLYKYLEQLGVADMAFAHRWMLLGFKREFSYEDSIRCFEIVSSHHLELSSMAAELIRDQERSRDYARNKGTNRLEDAPVNVEYTFDVFMCVTILIHHRDRMFRCHDSADVFQFIGGLSMNLDLDEILEQSEVLFFRYCRKSVVDCFQVVEPLQEPFPSLPYAHNYSSLTTEQQTSEEALNS